MRIQRPLAAGAALTAVALAVQLAPAAAQDGAATTVMAKGLNNPRGVQFGPDGALYVAEAGRGGPTCIKDAGCFGLSGSIARVSAGGTVKRVVTRLASGAEGGLFAGGATDVTFDTRGRMVTIVNGLPPARAIPARVRRQGARVARVTYRTFRPFARLDQIENRLNPDKQDRNPNPYGIERLGDTYYAIDAGGNTVIAIRRSQESVAAVIPNPARRVQPVPTAITTGPDGALYVSELAPGNNVGQVIRLVPGQQPTVVADKLPSATGISVAADRTIYLSIFGSGGEEPRPKTGSILRIAPDGTKSTIVRGLNFPAGSAIGADGDLYVANSSVMPGRAAPAGPFKGLSGEIVKVDLP